MAMSMEDKTFLVRLLALVIAILYGPEAEDDFRRAARREFSAHLNREEL